MDDLAALQLDAQRWRHAREHVHMHFDEPVRFSIGTADGKPVYVESQFPARRVEIDQAIDADMLRIQSTKEKPSE